MTAIAPALEEILDAIPLASRAEDEEAWFDARGEGVTASEIDKFRVRDDAKWGKILHEKLNGSRSRATAAMADGNKYEDWILGDLALQRDTTIVPNQRVWASADERAFMATPDAIEIDGDIIRGVEVKTHQHGWKPPAGRIPADHYLQMQWGMLVLGLHEWVYGWTVLDADREMTLDDCLFEVVERDEECIAELVAGARTYLQWVEDGAPVETLSDALQPHRDALVAAKAAAEAATADYTAARKRFDEALREETPTAFVTGWSHRGDDGTAVTYARPARTLVLDEAAWAKAEPESYAEWKRQSDAVAEVRATAAGLYKTAKTASAALRITPPKPAKTTTTKAKA